MSCSNCVCGLSFGITPLGWRLAKITPGGYPASCLGLGPVLPGFTDFLVYRLNVHFSANPTDLGDSLIDIRARVASTGQYPEVCDIHPATGLDECEAEEIVRVGNLLSYL
ncbi:hypothetical protein [Xenopus laevis endogenous retrovirus Xen1]|uniref:Uncharacterized protein n=2 Tax=root TaxID=1 RepID=Q8AEW2_9RETR|nr:hypothetical protein Xen1_gp1 [Xenopus laevis endogenous retrovirus Xen1]CAD44572.1 hypothetical protein [Xenopus laevis endogenous retrovirus Xen1]